MELKSQRLNVLTYPRAAKEVAESLSPRQADLMAVAVRRAADDAGAAMAHQLSEPLTVLLLYRHDLKERCELAQTDPAGLQGTVEMALRATERTCEILEDVGANVVAPCDIGAAVARGSEAIHLWKSNSRAAGRPLPAPSVEKHPLTSREMEVLTLVTDGASNKAGGQRLGISTGTFEVHRAHVMRKLGARNVADLVRSTQSRRQ